MQRLSHKETQAVLHNGLFASKAISSGQISFMRWRTTE